jgi:pentatricopeptide repeat protein
MLVGFNRLGRFREAVATFSEMIRAGILPTQFTFTNVLSSCASPETARVGQKVHSFAVKLGLGNCLPVANSLLNFYGKCGYVETAEKLFDKLILKYTSCWNTMISLYAQAGRLDIAVSLFDEMPEKNVISWNSVIAGCNQNGSYLKALDFFSLMLTGSDVEPDSFTLSTVLSSCTNLANLRQGKQIHAFIIRREAIYNNQVSNALVSMYAKSGKVDLAHKIIDKCMISDQNLISLTALLEGYVKIGNVVFARDTFDLMKQRDVVAWTAMIVGYEQNGFHSEAMDLFQVMLQEGVKPNAYTLAAILSVCASLAALDQGKQIHCRAIRSGEIDVISVSNAVLTMYAQCGNVDSAKRVFCKIWLRRQTVTWTSMVVALAQHGMGEDALDLFDGMLKLGVKPDHITYVGVLSACTHAGLVQKGKRYFEQMQSEHKIVPSMSHYACMIDLLSRAGKFEETEDFIAKMPVEPDSIAWGSLLTACRIHKNVEMAEKAAERLLAIDSWNSGAYSTLANIYSTCGEWNKAAEVWKRMRDKGIKKEQGVSSFSESAS